ncbi:MAG: NUDIX hydrolase [Actinomycetes bacterium]
MSAPRPPRQRTGVAKPAARRRMPRVEEVSAGGFVVDREGRVPKAALIARHDRSGRLVWSLPKGHVEEGETPEDAAVREVHEETGIRGSIVASLGTIDFWFMADNQRIHKTVHHYLLEAHDRLLSDADAEVVEVAWVPLDELESRLRYADERRLVPRVSELLGVAGPDPA